MLMAWSLTYFAYYIARSDKFILQMRMVDEIGEIVTPKDMAVTCYPETYTGALPSIAASDSSWFLQQPAWRQGAFQHARKVFLVEDNISKRECAGSDFMIKDKGRAVLTRQWTRGKDSLAVYALSPF